MLPAQVWTHATLQALVDGGVVESLTLEYKASAALSKDLTVEISKDVSALANSAGGRLIYGICERKADNGTRVPDRVDIGVVDPKITKEWLEQVLLSSIFPKLEKFIVHEIQLASGGRAYVVDVEQAISAAPHQASDRRYYRRRNFSVEPMEDYEIRDALRRGARPHPIVRVSIVEINVTQSSFHADFAFSVTNLKDEPIPYSTIKIYADKTLNPISKNKDLADRRECQFTTKTSQGLTFFSFHKNLMVPHHMPIFRGITYRLANLQVSGLIDTDYWLGYDISCPGYSGAEHDSFRVHTQSDIPVTSPNPTLFKSI
jgi:hypothetical protein